LLASESAARFPIRISVMQQNHQGTENRILFPFQSKATRKEGAVRCRERLGGLLRYYEVAQFFYWADIVKKLNDRLVDGSGHRDID
jgi:hypothetical protein